MCNIANVYSLHMGVNEETKMAKQINLLRDILSRINCANSRSAHRAVIIVDESHRDIRMASKTRTHSRLLDERLFPSFALALALSPLALINRMWRYALYAIM